MSESSVIKVEMGTNPSNRDGDKNSIIKAQSLDAGALFVLESKGTWLHAGFHLTTSIVAPALLSLPFAFASLGWAAGIICLTVGAAVTFYSYNLMSMVLEDLERQGKRQLRFRDVSYQVMGPRWARFLIGPIQFLVCYGAVVGCTLLGGQTLKFIYIIYHPDGSMKLYEFVICFGGLMLILGQMPSFHSLRHINLVSFILCLAYSLCAVVGSIHAGHKKGSEKDYSLVGSTTSKVFAALNAFSIIATTYGNGIIPEIQATLAPPVSGKMFKGLCVCYSVVMSTFFSVAISGYWAFGNKAAGTIYSNFVPLDRPALLPNWFLFMSNMFVLLQLSAVALVYLQPAFEVLERQSADVKMGRFSVRNLVPRLILRTLTIVIATLVAAMLPFFGDINAVIGAFGFLPLDFVLPMVCYNLTFKPSKRSIIFWANITIAVIFSMMSIVGCVAAVRQISLDADSYKLFANV
uniref:Amino acid transporter transmembrane domain-containing protein n=1 Tax=Araucaria cunninghamii TaxID=56994 RepID=A0A0D6QRI8_ARACU